MRRVLVAILVAASGCAAPSAPEPQTHLPADCVEDRCPFIVMVNNAAGQTVSADYSIWTSDALAREGGWEGIEDQSRRDDRFDVPRATLIARATVHYSTETREAEKEFQMRGETHGVTFLVLADRVVPSVVVR